MRKNLWAKLLERGSRLRHSEAASLFLDILRAVERGDGGLVKLVSFLSALSARGPGLNEVYGMCRAILRSRAKRVNLSFKGEAVQVGRTDRSNISLVNVTTPAAVLASAAGGVVLKCSFKQWSEPNPLELLESLGVNPYMDPKRAVRAAKKLHLLIWSSSISFKWSTRLAEVGEPYLELLEYSKRPLLAAISTSLNPFNAKRAFRGVPDLKLARLVANLFRKLRSKFALIPVGSGPNGAALNCLSNVGKTTIYEVSSKRISRYDVEPEDFGLSRARLEDVRHIESRELRAKVTVEILAGLRKGPLRDLVLLNAAGILYAAGKVKSIKDGCELCTKVISEGEPIKKLASLAKTSGGDVNKLKLFMRY
ncbi:MAG: hypothetical protein DRJ68_05045 [Thermoprotei archaeon]|nr:MAG: hypothetical protein DRJ62_01460 [Thermoprotei archaeon]RLF20423.1 MAG: hypothetical protein DRJ68_05045 [Thermoprotei archaeon]